MKFIFSVLFLMFLFSITTVHAAPITPTMQTNTEKYAQNITRAVQYLSNHYVPSVGLIYESEDSGVHWMKRVEVPSWHWRYNQTYWLYSDGLFSMAALEPWRPDLSTAINRTYEKYSLPFSNKFESIIGFPVGQDRGATDVIMNSSANFVVLYRIHNGTYADPNIPFADSIIYGALSEDYLGEQDLAVKDVNYAASLFNGTCAVDYGVTQTQLTDGNAPSDIQNCMNMKLALILYGAQVVGVNLPNFEQIEQLLWSMQQPNGGITTLADGHGNQKGSANAESTSLTLLNYNVALVTRLRNEAMQVPEFPSILIPLIALMSILPILALNRKRAASS